MTIHIHLIGTVADIKTAKALLPTSKAQRLLYGPSVYEQPETHSFGFSLPSLTEKYMAILVACATIMPTLLYRISDSIENAMQDTDGLLYQNYTEDPTTVILARYRAYPVPELIGKFESAHQATLPFDAYSAMGTACHYVASELSTLKRRHHLNDYEACKDLSATFTYIIHRLHVGQCDTSVEPAQNIDKRGYIQKSSVFEAAQRQFTAQLVLQNVRTAS